MVVIFKTNPWIEYWVVNATPLICLRCKASDHFSFIRVVSIAYSSGHKHMTHMSAIGIRSVVLHKKIRIVWPTNNKQLIDIKHELSWAKTKRPAEVWTSVINNIVCLVFFLLFYYHFYRLAKHSLYFGCRHLILIWIFIIIIKWNNSLFATRCGGSFRFVHFIFEI